MSKVLLKCPHDVFLPVARCPICDEQKIAELERHKKKLINHMIIMLPYNKDDSVRKGIEDWLEEQGE